MYNCVLLETKTLVEPFKGLGNMPNVSSTRCENDTTVESNPLYCIMK